MPTRRSVGFVLVLLVLAPAAWAQLGSGRVSGTIRDDRGKPIKGAIVKAENQVFFPNSLTSATDVKGRFSILGLRTTTYKLTILAEGFEQVTLTVPVRASQPSPPFDLRLVRKLEPAPPPLLANVDAGRLQQELDAAASLAARGQTDDAIAAYKRILRDAPALTSVNLQLGSLYEARGDRATAIASYEAALKGDPASSTARDALARLRRP